MRNLTFLMLFGAIVHTASAQGPFEFREAYLLEHRIFRTGESYDPSGAAERYAIPRPDLARQFIPNPDDPHVYQDRRWVGIVGEIDRARDSGGINPVEQHYLSILSMLRKTQGESTSDVALMLDHLAEFYLEIRSFDKAYDTFAEAVQVRRKTLEDVNQTADPQLAARTIVQILDADQSVMNYARGSNLETLAKLVARLHLADMLTRIGQLDLAKHDPIRASRSLSEAVAISNETASLPCATGIYALYFYSIALEEQAKWSEAEQLWREAVKLREPLNSTASFWDANAEMAAFYARRGNFHVAADIAAQVLSELRSKLPRQSPDIPNIALNSRRREEPQGGRYSLYRLDSRVAMSEILAIDKWRNEGAEHAAVLLEDPIQSENQSILGYGSDSEQSQLLNWFQQKAFLHMSILLDDSPTQDRIDKAYQLFSQIKGRYLASIRTAVQIYEARRGTQPDATPQLAALDRLAEERTKLARDFVGVALDGKPYEQSEFVERENRQGQVTDALASNNEVLSAVPNGATSALTQEIPPDTAFLDYISWERTDRNPAVAPHHEYGVFLLRKGQPIRYFSIAEVQTLDRDIDSLTHAMALKQPNQGNHPPSSNQLNEELRSLYRTTIAPLESSLNGVSKLWIAPDGKLAVAPIGAFVDAQGHYLLESRVVTYMTSWRDITPGDPSGNRTKTSPPVVIANPDFNAIYGDSAEPTSLSKRRYIEALRGTQVEAQEVAKDLGIPEERVLTGSRARKSLVESLQSPQIVHFATHSVPSLDWVPRPSSYDFFEFPRPLAIQTPLMESVIALAGANREN